MAKVFIYKRHDMLPEYLSDVDPTWYIAAIKINNTTLKKRSKIYTACKERNEFGGTCKFYLEMWVWDCFAVDMTKYQHWIREQSVRCAPPEHRLL